MFYVSACIFLCLRHELVNIFIIIFIICNGISFIISGDRYNQNPTNDIFSMCET